MCTDFTDFNKCCLKDDFPLIRIDQIIESATGCDIMALLDCFSGYHQIWLRKVDEEKTSFITPFETYCYMRKFMQEFAWPYRCLGICSQGPPARILLAGND
jgi:hypothetical protein